MAHFAKLDDNNIVIAVHVVNNDDVNNLPFPDSELIGVSFLANLYNGYTNWKQTSYNANFRKNYAGIGYAYDDVLDAFIPPKPYSSWILDSDTANWVAPVPVPTDGKKYVWNEDTLSWDVVNEN